MNPSSGEAPKFELPAQPVEYKTESHDKDQETLPKQENAVGKRPPSNTQAVSPDPAPPVPLPVAPAYQPASATDDSTDDSSTGLTAAEIDRIEKEWIDRAKSIVSKTQDDPFEQNTAMSRVKAEYIKKRFNKTIPTDDTVTA